MGGHLPGRLLQLPANVRLLSIIFEAAEGACLVPAGKVELQHLEQRPAEGEAQPLRSSTGAYIGRAEDCAPL